MFLVIARSCQVAIYYCCALNGISPPGHLANRTVTTYLDRFVHIPFHSSLMFILPSGMGFGMVQIKMAMALWRTVAHGHLVPQPEWGEQASAKAAQHYYNRVTSLATDS